MLSGAFYIYSYAECRYAQYRGAQEASFFVYKSGAIFTTLYFFATYEWAR